MLGSSFPLLWKCASVPFAIGDARNETSVYRSRFPLGLIGKKYEDDKTTAEVSGRCDELSVFQVRLVLSEENSTKR